MTASIMPEYIQIKKLQQFILDLLLAKINEEFRKVN